jgi:hypothetical protein
MHKQITLLIQNPWQVKTPAIIFIHSGIESEIDTLKEQLPANY